MAPKRKTDDGEGDGEARQQKRAKKGFSVGPANLPDGTYRRKGESRKQPPTSLGQRNVN